MDVPELVYETLGAKLMHGLAWAVSTGLEAAWMAQRPEAGHTNHLLGRRKHDLMRDRLHRLCQTDRYSRSEDDDGSPVPFGLMKGISSEDFEAMPTIEPGFVDYDPIYGSPGWRVGEYRFFMASCRHGDVAKLNDLKLGQVRRGLILENISELQPSLFSVSEQDGYSSTAKNLTIAHSMDPFTGDYEVRFGLITYSEEVGYSWEWSIDLMEFLGLTEMDEMPLNAPVSVEESVPDVEVRLKHPISDKRQSNS